MSKLVIQSSEDEGQGLERVTAYVGGRFNSTDMKLLQPSKELSRLEVLWQLRSMDERKCESRRKNKMLILVRNQEKVIRKVRPSAEVKNRVNLLDAQFPRFL